MLVVRRHRVNHVNRARTYKHCLRQQWNSVLFFDESRFTIHRGGGSVRVYRRRNGPYTDYTDCCVLERDRFGGGGGGSVLVWTGIAHGFCTNIVVIEGNLNAQRYRDGILAAGRHAIPLFQNNSNIILLQHGNATSHTARDTVNFLRENNIVFIDD